MVSDLVPLGSERWKTKPVSWKRKSLLEEEYGMDATFTICIYIIIYTCIIMYIYIYIYAEPKQNTKHK